MQTKQRFQNITIFSNFSKSRKANGQAQSRRPDLSYGANLNKKYYLDNFSNLILYNKDYFSDNFPEVFGEEAEKNFVSFFNDLQTNNFPSARIKKYYYFQVGRWDLLLKNDQLIKFPAERLNEAIKQSLDLIEKEEFKSYKVIDLRINGKIIVE